MADPTPSVRGSGAALFKALADLSFTRYATPAIVPVIYALTVAIHVLGALWIIAAAFAAGIGYGMLSLVAAPIVALVSLAFMRVVLEYLSAVIYIAETVRAYGRRDGVS